ncbi:MAG: DNA helicase RecQ [Gammaproteobacteria bacterium]|nr:DNA helicase RecQ [Gammaproteobacteria bacterium]
MSAARAGTSREVLAQVFGFAEFRGQQERIIEHVIGGGDAVVLMPTGGGKSLCYQIPSLVRAGTGVVISPLISLMDDQVAALAQNGVRAAALNSTLDAAAAREVERELRSGELDLLYLAPERLVRESTLALLADCELALFAIDEAHCVSQWGHDFRPEYLALDVLAERFPGVPRMALTATADGPTRAEMRERLLLEHAELFVSGFDRPNIRYQVGEKRDPRAQLLAFLEAGHRGDAGIVYCLARKKVDETAAWLAARGYDALPYHAGLDDAERRAHQARFAAEEGVVMVATIAFGMGIDKPNVRFVAHLDLPKSIEAYYQETGRAGRDGLPADAWMIYGLQDVIRLRQMVDASGADEHHKRIEWRKLETILGFCEVTSCRRQVLLEHFGERLAAPCGNCDNCLAPPQTWDGTEAAQKALSCVYRTGQRFGVSYLVDVLRGRDDERMRRFGHDRQSTFGIGTELDAQQWRSVFRQLVARGLLTVDVEGYGGLSLAPASRALLRGEERIELRRAAAPARRTRSKKDNHRAGDGRDAGVAAVSLGAADEALWEALRRRRLELARAQGVPPYVVFHDTTLTELASRRPTTLAAMAGITGVGESKLERYGETFLEVIREHAS